MDWHIALHAYPAILTDPVVWAPNSYTPQNLGASFISCANLNIFTDYVKNTYGSQHRISLSEVGLTAAKGNDIQAAGIAYCYYMAECNDMVDAIIFRAYRDAAIEVQQGLSFRLIDINGNRRPSYDVFQYMDTKQGEAHTSGARATIGISSWEEVIFNYAAHADRFR